MNTKTIHPINLEVFITVQVTNKVRNPDIPATWIIFNAPRPLFGTITNGIAADWTGEFVDGAYYAAVDPTDPFALDWIDENRRNKAVILQYPTREEVVQAVKAFCKQEGYCFEDLETEAEITQAFHNIHSR